MTGRAGTYRTARIVAIVTGLLGVLLALATPLLPVKQTTAQLNWPQNGVFSSVTAPLIAYVATDLEITVPCRAAAGLDNTKTVLLSTVPKQAPKAIDRGLLIQRVGDNVLVIVRNTPVVTAPLSQVLSPTCRELTFTAHADKVTGEFVGLVKGPDSDNPGAPLKGVRDGYDFRPQIVGVFTDLSGPAPPGLSFSATIDSRYSSAPALIKLLAMILGVAMTVVSLIALHVLDTADGMRHRRFLPARWWSLTPLDGVVAAVLVWWHFVGANTADDGYILTMARVSENAGYMANYYRWFGTPEAPFGWYYDLLSVWSHVSTTSVWVRLPTLVMALMCWWLISREVMPRLGHAVKTYRAAAWTAAGLFLAFWLPLNNGLRPEPIIALGILLTWCSVERAVATNRLLPLAFACIIGALTLFSGPTGIASIGALLVAIGPLRTILHRRSAQFGYLALLTPIVAACTVTTILIFRDQTLIGEVEATSLKSAVGPSLSWFDEHIRYERLFMATPDGSIARRFAVLALIVALAVAIAMSLRKGRIPGTAAGPSQRIIGITVISFIAMMFTPTKWTHHFGVFAGLAGPLGALAAVAVTAAVMRSQRNRAVFAALVLFMTALSFASVNGYWYVSNFGVPWSNSFPSFEFGFTTALLGLTVLVLLVAAWFHFSGRQSDAGESRWQRILQSPLAILCWLLVAFEVYSLTAAMVGQYPAWTVGRSNIEALSGKTCGLASDVMVEQDPNAGMLTPVGVPIADGLGAVTAERFTPTGIPADVSADPVMQQPGSDAFVDSSTGTTTAEGTGTEGGTTAAIGINGSRAQLPFYLDPSRTPVLGSYQSGIQAPAALRSAWYRLPARSQAGPLLVVSAAGRFDAREVTVQWAGDDGKVTGSASLADVGSPPAWRNLRLPLSAIPEDATPDSPDRHRRRPGSPALDRADPAADRAPAHPAGSGGVGRPRAAGLAGGDGVPVPAPVRPQQRGGRGADVADPAGSVRRRGELTGDGQPGWRPAGHHRTAAAGDHRRHLPEQRLVPRLGLLQRLTLYYPDAKPARLDLGSATRSGLWSPAPMRH